jgi:hypothetical protein
MALSRLLGLAYHGNFVMHMVSPKLWFHKPVFFLSQNLWYGRTRSWTGTVTPASLLPHLPKHPQHCKICFHFKTPSQAGYCRGQFLNATARTWHPPLNWWSRQHIWTWELKFSGNARFLWSVSRDCCLSQVDVSVAWRVVHQAVCRSIFPFLPTASQVHLNNRMGHTTLLWWLNDRAMSTWLCF